MEESLKQTLLALDARLERAHSQGAVWIAKDVARKLKKLTPLCFKLSSHDQGK